MSHDRSSVEDVVQHYFDDLYEGDADKLGAISPSFRGSALAGKGRIAVFLTVPDWLGRVRKRPSAKGRGQAAREDFIVCTIDRSDESTWPSSRSALPAAATLLHL